MQSSPFSSGFVIVMGGIEKLTFELPVEVAQELLLTLVFTIATLNVGTTVESTKQAVKAGFALALLKLSLNVDTMPELIELAVIVGVTPVLLELETQVGSRLVLTLLVGFKIVLPELTPAAGFEMVLIILTLIVGFTLALTVVLAQVVSLGKLTKVKLFDFEVVIDDSTVLGKIQRNDADLSTVGNSLTCDFVINAK